MTQQRNDEHSTEFGLWLRDQMWGGWINNDKYPIAPRLNAKKQMESRRVWREPDLISSYLGFRAYNVDYIWRNKNSKLWMLIEEKRHKAEMKTDQESTFSILDSACKSDKNYRGFHTIVFSNTFPEDGGIQLDNVKITKEQLIKFLRFEDYK